MRKTALTFFVFLLAVMAFSQQIASDKVPGPVKQAFTRQFPTAKGVQYGADNGNYKILFMDQGKQNILTYNPAGKLLESEKEISPSGLPKEVTASVTKNFPGYTIVATVKREAFDKGICYEMDLKKGEGGYSVRFSDKGEILQQEARKVEYKVTTKQKK
ncbi:MAG: PepSY-like domain-containing protein [Bacteroidetes bacterium]|nr:PepSY-like domain-containing protein [Bacteroidota bacterium]